MGIGETFVSPMLDRISPQHRPGDSNNSIDWGPAWYPIALVLVTLPCAWLGGKLAERRANELS